MIKKIFVLTSILFALTILDVVSTMLVLGKGGIEANPLVVYVWNNIGFLNSVILKIALILFMGIIAIFAYCYAKKYNPAELNKCSLIINGLLYFLLIYNSAVVANNFYWFMVMA